MQIKINSSVLSEGLKKVGTVVNWKNSIPVLQGIYMECTNENIILIGSDSSETLRFHIPVNEEVEVISTGKVVLPQQAFDILTKKLKNKKINLSIDGDKLSIKYGKKSEVNLVTFDVSEYPKLPQINLEEPTFTIKGSDFNAAISKTFFTASTSETRPILQGVNVIVNQSNVILVSTDSHRLGKATLNYSADKEHKFVVPAKALEKITKTFEPREDVNIYCETDNMVIFGSGSIIFYVRLLEGNYPDTSRLIPTEFQTEVKVNRKELLEAIDRISGIADASNNSRGVIKCHINGAVEISTSQSQLGDGVETIDYLEFTGDELQIAFSSKFVTDALKSMDDDEVYLKFCGAMRPFVVVPTKSDIDELQLILPVRSV